MAAELVSGYLHHVDWEYYKDIDWTPEPQQTFLLGSRYADLGITVVFAVLFPFIRAILRRLVYEPLGIHIMFNPKKTDAKVDPERLRKWNESFWKMSVYIVFTCLAFAASYGEKWFTDTRHLWRGCTSFPPCNLVISKGVLLFYCAETGFYLQAIHFLAFHETRRKDWLESMIHHVVTVFLLVYSYHVNFARVGVMVILVHDVSDIFLEAAKLSRYAKAQGLAEACFIIFTISWIVLRVIIFPVVLIRSTLVETLVYAKLQNVGSVEPAYSIFNGLLLVLLVLHIYWTYLILRIVANSLRGQNPRDIREDDDNDDD